MVESQIRPINRIDPERGIRRFYSFIIETDLFGNVRLVRNWKKIGTKGGAGGGLRQRGGGRAGTGSGRLGQALAVISRLMRSLYRKP